MRKSKNDKKVYIILHCILCLYRIHILRTVDTYICTTLSLYRAYTIPIISNFTSYTVAPIKYRIVTERA
jgi:hypothetical protein